VGGKRSNRERSNALLCHYSSSSLERKMRKWLTFVLAFVLVFTSTIATVLPAAAFLNHWEASNTPAGVTVPDNNADTLTWTATDWEGWGGSFGARYRCEGEGCSSMPVFLELYASVEFVDRYGHAPYKFKITYGGYNVSTYYREVACPSSSICTVHIFAYLPAEEVSGNPEEITHAFMDVALDGTIGGTQTWDIRVTISGQSLWTESCDIEYQPVLTVDGATIPVTNENGLVTETLEAGKKYRLTVIGGPWNDGEGNDERYDSAVKQGESYWQPTEELAGADNILCNQFDPDDPHKISFVFTALDATFAIRVNDVAGAFANNSYASSVMTYTLEEVAPLLGYDCADQFLAGATLGTVTVAATNSTGVSVRDTLGSKYPAAGDWIIFQVTGAWKDNGAGDDLQTMSVKVSPHTTWEDLGTSSSTGCFDSDNATYYYQMKYTDGSLMLRVADDDVSFANNTGSLVVTIKGVAKYSRFESDCELNYQVGDFIETSSIPANEEDGVQLNNPNATTWPWYALGGEFETPMRYYMLETFSGPADIGDDVTYDVDLGQSTHVALKPQQWYEGTAATFVDCSVVLDPVGHVRLFFPIEDQTDLYEFQEFYYGIRIRDEAGTYSENTGAVSYRLYEATSLQLTDAGTPTVDGCIQFSHETDPIYNVTVAGYNDLGVKLPAMTQGILYSLEITEGPWKDNGTARYDLEMSTDDGDTWQDLLDYTGLLCSQSADGNHVIVYVKGAPGQKWWLRVNDQDANFGNNTDYVRLKMYPSTTGIDPWPKCDDNYTLIQAALSDEQRTVPANMANGAGVPLISKGGTYAIEITDEGGWYEAGTGTKSYLVEISDDGGSTWADLEEYSGSLCTMLMSKTAGQFKIYFEAASGNYRLRVRDTDANFLTNTGYIMFKLWTATDKTNPGGSLPPEWRVACNQSYTRPNGLIEWQGVIPVPRVGDWIEYAKNAIIFYLAWCPQHTSALENMTKVYEDKEPIASFITFYNIVKDTKEKISTYFALGGEDGITSMEPALFADSGTAGAGAVGGESSMAAVPSNPLDVFLPGTVDRESNIFFGGDLDLTSGFHSSTPSAAFITICESKYGSILGVFSSMYCKTLGMVRTTDLITYLILAVDILATLWWLFKYFPEWIGRAWDIVFGGNGRSIISKGLGRLVG
jgi:hypothetical protein